MTDLRIIIASWNNEKQLGECLSSLPAACEGLSWDVVVIDNASSDESVSISHASIGDRGRIIVNAENRGFAKACNQGLVGLDARYVLLLNPDTVCPAGSLTKLVQAADAHPEAGILGPKLLNTDGSAQKSIRRFPSVWNQVGILLKLQNIFPNLFSRYFASDLSLDEGQDVDQVMGACFLIRRKVVEEIGGLDERYFIWFEEVDYCRQAKLHGWATRYAPSVQVMHSGGQSFDQVRSVVKQRLFNASMVSYFQKWHAGWRATLLRALCPIAVALAWVVGVMGVSGKGSRNLLGGEASEAGRGRASSLQGIGGDASSFAQTNVYWAWIGVVIAVEVISRLTIFHNAANGVVCLVIGAIIAVLAYKRPTLALAALVMELLIGSQGHLFQLWGWPGFASVRVVMFGSFFVGYVMRMVGRRQEREDGIAHQISRQYPVRSIVVSPPFFVLMRERWEWFLLAAIVVYAFVRGVALGNDPVLADANAWIFIWLIVPVLDIAKREGELLKKDILPVMIVGSVWLAMKALGLEFLYAHGLAVVDPPSAFHLWIRRSGTGEITPLSDNLFRVFMQSQVFALLAFLLTIARYFTTQGKGLLWVGHGSRVTGRGEGSLGWHIFLVASCVSLVIGQSRSLWVGTLAGGMVLAGLLLRKGGWCGLMRLGQTGLYAAVGIVAALLLITMMLVSPSVSGDARSVTDVTERVTVNDAAGNSRRELLNAMIVKIKEHPMLGSGFGAQVSYRSSDPRVLAQNPDGLYTTYAFEWGWLEHWIKFGIVGFGLMIVIVWRLGERILKTPAPDWMRYGLFASLIALAVTHIFTPYLNHPLGLGYLMMLEGWVVSYRKMG